jgi:DNA-directed RNA polymerase specialized sigma24 family protein
MRNSGAPIRLHECMPVDAMPFPEATETETERIARGLRHKDAALISEMVDRYQYRLVRYLIYLTGRREQVEDLVQVTWVRVLTRATQYGGHARFETWLFSIAMLLGIRLVLTPNQWRGIEAVAGPRARRLEHRNDEPPEKSPTGSAPPPGKQR